MDRKTLTWMSDRVDKGKLIVQRIEDLTRSAERVDEIRVLTARDRHAKLLFTFDSDRQPELILTIRAGLTKMIAEEIERLERELAEL